MIIEELVPAPPDGLFVRAPEADPLREPDALQEGQLVDIRISAVQSVAALLFDLRTSLQFDEGNASLLIIRGLSDLQWSETRTRAPLTAFTVAASATSTDEGGLIEVNFGFFPDARLTILGIEAEFYVLKIPKIGEVPPDYSEAHFEAIKNSVPVWSSPCSILQGSRIAA